MVAAGPLSSSTSVATVTTAAYPITRTADTAVTSSARRNTVGVSQSPRRSVAVATASGSTAKPSVKSENPSSSTHSTATPSRGDSGSSSPVATKHVASTSRAAPTLRVCCCSSGVDTRR